VLEGPLEYERAGRKSAAVTKGPQNGRKLSARTPPVPLASNWQSHRQTLAPVLIPDVLALRRLARNSIIGEMRRVP